MNNRPYTAYLCILALILLFIKGLWHGLTVPAEEVNLYLLQAESFLKGSLDIGQKAHDAAVYEGRYYVPFPPFPAVLLMPFVLLFGAAKTNVVLVSLGLSLLNARLLYLVLKKIGIGFEGAIWILAGFFMGTAYWMAVKGSFGVWYFAHVVFVTAMVCAIYEAFFSSRGWVVGLFIAMAFLSRHMAIYSLPFFAAVIWTKRRSLWSIIGLLAPIIFAVEIYMLLNEARFGSPFNTGYSYILQAGFLQERLSRYGLFNIHYIPFNFAYLFLQAFHIEFEGNDMLSVNCLDPFGTALTFASPFLLISFFAKWNKMILISAWISILLMIIHSLLYYANGYYQINAERFTMDFMPILILLAARGSLLVNPRIWKPLIVYSILLNILASAICKGG